MTQESEQMMFVALATPFVIGAGLFLASTIVFGGTPEEAKKTSNNLKYAAVAFLALGVLMVGGAFHVQKKRN